MLHPDLDLRPREKLSGSLGADIPGSTGTSPVRTAMNGNLSRVAEVFGTATALCRANREHAASGDLCVRDPVRS
jgi:hypothetical protein